MKIITENFKYYLIFVEFLFQVKSTIELDKHYINIIPIRIRRDSSNKEIFSQDDEIKENIEEEGSTNTKNEASYPNNKNALIESFESRVSYNQDENLKEEEQVSTIEGEDLNIDNKTTSINNMLSTVDVKNRASIWSGRGLQRPDSSMCSFSQE